ncbi:MAG: HIRAN domain-containing protein, partial [Pseudomonadota bacterium]|nr:HIRAN domain-containing protein [Pseudomonadota bacterium]
MLTGRRNFIKRSLLLTVVCFGSSAKTRAESRFYHLNRFSVAGFQYYAGMQLISLLHPTAGLNLIAEPENQHDEYAVRIEWRGQKLGYVP